MHLARRQAVGLIAPRKLDLMLSSCIHQLVEQVVCDLQMVS